MTSGSSRQSSRPASARRLGRFRLRHGGGGKDVRDRVGVNGDQADRALGLERAQPFRHARAREAVAAAARRHLDRDQIAVARVRAGAGGIASSRPSCFLSIGSSRPPPPGVRAENAEHALLAAVDELDDAPGVMDRIVLVAAVLDPQQDAVADAGDLVGPRTARNAHADLGRGAVLGLIPFGRNRDQLAVAVARAVTSATTTWGSVPGWCSFLRRLLDAAFVARARAACVLSAARSAFFMPKARAISRVPTLPGCWPMKATRSSLEGSGVWL